MKRTRKTVIALVLFFWGSVVATATAAAERPSDPIRRDAPKGITEAFYACIDEADSNDIEEANCLSVEEKAQDARLNRTYKALLVKLDKKDRGQLVDAERAWLAYHHKTSRLESTLYGSELVADLQVSQNDIFRLCERANTLTDYLSLVSDK